MQWCHLVFIQSIHICTNTQQIVEHIQMAIFCCNMQQGSILNLIRYVNNNSTNKGKIIHQLLLLVFITQASRKYQCLQCLDITSLRFRKQFFLNVLQHNSNHFFQNNRTTNFFLTPVANPLRHMDKTVCMDKLSGLFKSSGSMYRSTL